MSQSANSPPDPLQFPPGTPIWLPSPTTVWKCVTLQSYTPQTSTLTYTDPDSPTPTTILTININTPPLPRNPTILIGQNDLTSLSYLHEPAVLHNLQHRFNLNTIYTYCGIVLVAINPYEELDIYNRETILAYRGSGNELDPHIFAVAEQAYNKMERDSLNQSIIVSGESGAGKTVSAKYAMRYFATVGGSENETQIEQKVLASSPIMEAIGNAKTTRNDNSSRFGKYVELHFSPRFSITGASMRTYLLEKSRVVYQSPGERNYHIFYQMCSTNHSELSELYLQPASNFHYTNQGSTDPTPSDNFNETVQSLTLLGFGLDNRRNFFKVLASILQLGNIQFNQGSNDEATISKDSKPLANFIQLLSIDGDLVRKTLTTKSLFSGNEIIIKKLSTKEANYSRDALAKLIYSELFNWVVKIVNETLLKYTLDKIHKFIGVLDIYGFETFEINSFEQFCINYANEKLQQQFNQHVFKLEQEEYIREGISWTMIDFYDNQPCIDLIESKLGILDLLDEECKLGSGSDSSWVLKLHSKCITSKHYVKPRMDSDKGFLIKHFADDVGYSCTGFIEKNRDLVGGELVGAIGKNPFLQMVLASQLAAPTAATQAIGKSTGGKKVATTTVGSSFRDSLTLLMASLNKTTPHYVRCIKPNDEKLPFVFDPHRAVQQLRACGVLETIRISAAGFPSRWTYADFYARYRMLDNSKKREKNPILSSKNLIENLLPNPDTYRLGSSKIFFRSGQVAYLERIRLEKLQRAGLIIQKNIKMFAKRNVYKKLQKSIRLLQNHARGFLARKHALFLRQTRAAIKIQSYYRMWSTRCIYKSKLTLINKLQTRIRGFLARKYAAEMKDLKYVTKIQSYFRGCLIRRKVSNHKKRIVLAQCCIRRFLAKRRLRMLKTEARSLEHVKQTNKGLENKIISLQQKIQILNKDIEVGKLLKIENEKFKNELINFKSIEKEGKNQKIMINNLNLELDEVKKVLELEKTEKFDLVIFNEKKSDEILLLRKELDLKSELINDLREKILQLESEVNLKNGYVEKNTILELELDAERRKYMDIVVKSEGAVISGGGVGQHQIPVAKERTSLERDRLEKRIKDLEVENSILRKSGGGGGALVAIDDGEISSALMSQRELNQNLESKYNSLLSSLQNPSIQTELERLIQENFSLKQQLSTSEPTTLEELPFHVVKKKHVQYLGMLEYKQDDLDRILRALVTDLPPSLALSSTPTKSLPAYLIFLMIRYTDYINDDERVRVLLTKAINSIKRLIRKRGTDHLDLLILWMCNMTRLLHTLKQYCGDTGFQKDNTLKQNEQCLKNFDLVEYRQVLSDHAVWVYTLLIKSLEDSLQSLIVPAILESTCDPTAASISKPLDSLIGQLDKIYNLLDGYGLELSVTFQIFKQLFYYICAGALNNLLLRRELCHWSKGVDIRFNISGLQEWTRGKRMPDEILLPTLAPLIQASQILQARKTDKDAGSIVEICDDLSAQQVVKLLNLYSSKDGLDSDKVSKQLISAVQEKLTELRSNKTSPAGLLMDTKFSFSVKFDFCPSSVKLEEIVIPETFGISAFVKML